MPDTRINYDLATALKDSERRYATAKPALLSRFSTTMPSTTAVPNGKFCRRSIILSLRDA